MAWRRRNYRKRVGSAVYGVVNRVQRALRAKSRARAAYRDAKKYRRIRSYLRRQGIAAGSPYMLSAAQPSEAEYPSLREKLGDFGRVRLTPEMKAARNPALFYGRGAYSLGKAWRQVVGKQAGRRLRDAVVNQAVQGISGGGMMGGISAAYGGAGLYSGRGEYNQLIEGGRTAMNFSGANDETSGLIVTHREYLQDVYGAPSSAFSVEGWALNPGIVENFPWLSQMAANYEEYEFMQLVFEYKSTIDVSAASNTTGATGTLIMATNYNPTAPLFSNKEAMMQYHGANSGRIVDDHCHGVECDPSKNAGSPQKYVRVTGAVPGQDLKTFDLGTFQLAQVNLPSAFYNAQIGELWVYYTVRLDKPRLYASLGGMSQEVRFAQNSTTPTNVVATPVTGVSMTETIQLSNLLRSSAAGFCSMVQNQPAITIGGTWSATWVNGTGQSGSGNLLVNFPDFLTGVFELQLYMEGQRMSVIVGAPVFGGSTSAYNDMLAVGSTTTDTPSNNASVLSSDGSAFVSVFHIRVQPVVAGADNVVTLPITFSNTAPVGQSYIVANAINQVQVVIRQINPFLASSPANPLPQYQNSIGVLVDPTL